MKFLEARKKNGQAPNRSVVPEHKMQSGVRLDQKDPASLISSPHARKAEAPKREDRSEAERSGPAPSTEVMELAQELGVDLTAVTGTGPDGLITKRDVRNAKRAMDKTE